MSGNKRHLELAVVNSEWDQVTFRYEFEMRDAGNCFQTFEEAEAALERFKKALKGE